MKRWGKAFVIACSLESAMLLLFVRFWASDPANRHQRVIANIAFWYHWVAIPIASSAAILSSGVTSQLGPRRYDDVFLSTAYLIQLVLTTPLIYLLSKWIHYARRSKQGVSHG